jgi:hypothetical protein
LTRGDKEKNDELNIHTKVSTVLLCLKHNNTLDD